jgi:hypothetical protein
LSGTVCVRAVRPQKPIFVPDVSTDEHWTPS